MCAAQPNDDHNLDVHKMLNQNVMKHIKKISQYNNTACHVHSTYFFFFFEIN